MLKHFSARFVGALTATCAALTSGVTALGQGTITFNGANGLSSTYYQELGMWFQVVIPPGTSGVDVMGITFGAENTPWNGTPFMGWARLHNPYDYVELHLTNGSSFGLSSVQLADPVNPALSPVSISFIGYPAVGSAVTNTFTTPGPALGDGQFGLHSTRARDRRLGGPRAAGLGHAEAWCRRTLRQAHAFEGANTKRWAALPLDLAWNWKCYPAIESPSHRPAARRDQPRSATAWGQPGMPGPGARR